MSADIAFEPVLTMTDYFDGPREGIAYFRGRPCLYKSMCVDVDSDSEDEFVLTPLSPEAVEAALEDWAIWLRWEEAFHLGHAEQASHPALPADRARHEELASRLDHELQSDPESPIRMRGEFRVRAENSKQFGLRELEVRWTPYDNGG